MTKQLFLILIVSAAWLNCRSQPKPPAAALVPCILLVADTSNHHFAKDYFAHWMYGYKAAGPAAYFGGDKKPLPKNIVVWICNPVTLKSH